MKYEYSVDKDGYDGAFSFEPESKFGSCRDLTEQAAEDFYSQHDGWESSWPIIFQVFCNGESLGKFNVEREMVPVFIAKLLKDA